MKKKAEKGPNSERWLLTYSDLITLLMIFFIIMYAMSNVNQKKFQNLAQSMSSVMGSGGGKNIISEGGSYADSSAVIDTVNVPKENTQDNESKSGSTEEKKLTNLKEEVDTYLKQSGLSQTVATASDDRGVVITVKDAFFFDSGKADIKTQYAERLSGIADILNKVDNSIIVEGYTDSVPIYTYEYPDNEYLGFVRAYNVKKLLISRVPSLSGRIHSEAFGPDNPVASNDTEEGKAKNRRVEIVILNSKLSASQTGN